MSDKDIYERACISKRCIRVEQVDCDGTLSINFYWIPDSWEKMDRFLDNLYDQAEGPVNVTYIDGGPRAEMIRNIPEYNRGKVDEY